MDEATIRARVRSLLDTGEIPCESPGMTWASKGTGSHCVACARAIAAHEIEFEVEVSGQIYRVHRHCYIIWQEECEPIRKG